MKLAEALIGRADLKARIEQIVSRMKENALIQEGDEPVEDVAGLIDLYESIMDQLEELTIRINKTNTEITLTDTSLADAIAKRDCLKARISVYRRLKEASLIKHDRYSGMEIRYVRTTDVVKLQRMIDDYSKQYRELDMKIQERNWTVDLM